MARSFTEREKENIRRNLQEACKQSWTQYGYKKTSVVESKEALFCQVLCSVQEQICNAALEVIRKYKEKHGVAEALKLIYREYDKNNFLYNPDSTDFTILMNKLSEEEAKKIEESNYMRQKNAKKENRSYKKTYIRTRISINRDGMAAFMFCLFYQNMHNGVSGISPVHREY